MKEFGNDTGKDDGCMVMDKREAIRIAEWESDVRERTKMCLYCRECIHLGCGEFECV